MKRVTGLQIILYFLIFISITTVVKAQEEETPDDSSAVYNPSERAKLTYWTRLFHGNVDRSYDKKIDISFVAAPSYTREASFGAGGIASALYRLDRTDSLMPPSNISVAANASIIGFYSVILSGNNNFKGRRSHLSYTAAFTSKNLDLWGFSYDACATNLKSKYTRRQIRIDADYVYKLKGNFYIGAAVNFTDTEIKEIDNPEYLNGDKNAYTFTEMGFSLQYDSRDFIPNPQKGVYLLFRQTIFPRFLGNYDKTLFRTSVIANYYQPMWKGSILALDFFTRFSSADLPWALEEELGNSFRMRGYYMGRYIDNDIITCQAEIRQHLYKRFGCVAWVGGGTVFPSLKGFSWSHILPNYGFGLRWEFKHNINARVDYGLGKGTGGFVFNISEAF